MSHDELRQQICFAAARLLQSRQESDFHAARWRAARSVVSGYVPGAAWPTDMEIRHTLQLLVTGPITTGTSGPEDGDDPFTVYFELMAPLDRVRLPVDTHPEGDLLYHSLQVFELAHEHRPWDPEFLTAALLHECGRGLDPYDSHNATLDAVAPFVSDRTFWLIENLPTQHRLSDGTIGIRARRRLVGHEDGEILRLLAWCDSDGRIPGRQVRSLEDCLQTIRELADE